MAVRNEEDHPHDDHVDHAVVVVVVVVVDVNVWIDEGQSHFLPHSAAVAVAAGAVLVHAEARSSHPHHCSSS